MGVVLASALSCMCKSDQFYPNPTWVIPLRSANMDVRQVASIWKTMMNPHDITMEDISNVFFDTITRVSNMRYFNAQQIVLDRQVEERQIYRALMKVARVGVDVDVVDHELDNL